MLDNAVINLLHLFCSEYFWYMLPFQVTMRAAVFPTSDLNILSYIYSPQNGSL